jgi:hypothetical protein
VTKTYDDVSDDDLIDSLLWNAARSTGIAALCDDASRDAPNRLTNRSARRLTSRHAIGASATNSIEARRGNHRNPPAGSYYRRNQGGSSPKEDLSGRAHTGAMGRLFERSGEDAAIESVDHLLAVATALIEHRIDSPAIERTRSEIVAGGDPLGEAYSRLRSPNTRRQAGITLTPARIVKSMIDWTIERAGPSPPLRIVDPGAGTGRFSIAAAQAFPEAEVVAIENDPQLATLLRANFRVLDLCRRARVVISDFRAVELPAVPGKTLFIGNPPYVRHHNIERHWKEWYAKTCARRGIAASQLAGLHLHFFAKLLEIGKVNDFGCFITAAEWLDVGYGSALRQLLAGPLGGSELHVLEPTAEAFPGTMTTSAITAFAIGQRADRLAVRRVAKSEDLDRLEGGTAVTWADATAARRWSVLIRGAPPREPGSIELGESCRVHRGQVTGANQVWIAGAHARGLPASVLKPTITAAVELIAAGAVLDDDSHLSRVIDLPASLDLLPVREQIAVERFIAWARSAGAADGYIARHRTPWWAIRLREPAPIVCTYMARRAPAFVRNRVGARLLNIAHGIYPREELTEDGLITLVETLRCVVSRCDGRTYAGGLTKFEPSELERVRIPWPPVDA